VNVSLTGGQATMTGPILAPAGSILQVSVSGNIHSPGATGILARRGIDTILVDGDIGCHIVANYDNSDPGSGRLRSLLCGSLHGDMSATTLGDDDPYSSDPAVAIVGAFEGNVHTEGSLLGRFVVGSGGGTIDSIVIGGSLLGLIDSASPIGDLIVNGGVGGFIQSGVGSVIQCRAATGIGRLRVDGWCGTGELPCAVLSNKIGRIEVGGSFVGSIGNASGCPGAVDAPVILIGGNAYLTCPLVVASVTELRCEHRWLVGVRRCPGERDHPDRRWARHAGLKHHDPRTGAPPVDRLERSHALFGPC
jgi:hypothetical protein